MGMLQSELLKDINRLQVCAQRVAAHVVLKSPRERGLRRPGQSVADNIVGTGTIRQMDREWLTSKQHGGWLMAGTTETLKQDI